MVLALAGIEVDVEHGVMGEGVNGWVSLSIAKSLDILGTGINGNPKEH